MHLMNLSLRSGMLPLTCALVASLGAGCSIDDAETPAGAGIDIKRYDLKGEYDWDRGRLLATVDITLSPTAEGMTTIVLDSAVTMVKAVRLSGGGALPFSTETAKEQLRVDVSKVAPLTRDADITLEIDYEAAPSASFLSVGSRKGDPLKARSLFTMSEPLGADTWMPCHNTPSDRALFSIDMRMDAAEKMIANGVVVVDEAGAGGSHRMKYETAYTLPTYLMAFAISDFEVESAMKGSLPVSIWHRRGLEGEYKPVLEETVGMIDRFEGLLGPYPFEGYAVVHVPMLPASGIENAGITFQYEGSGAVPISGDLSLNAHELGHQWFGDLVTVQTWDDVWIKEGMASLLELEALRPRSDKDGPMTLNGDGLYMTEGVAIRDRALLPDDKYTSGPYGRAGWLLTQIRGLVGEETFWKTLRGVLEAHRFGSIGTEDFLGAFAKALGPEATARAKRAVDAKGLPKLEVAALPTGGATLVLRDPDGALVAPLDVAWMAEDGSVRRETLPLDQPFTLAPTQSGEFLLMDPLDIHPSWDAFLADQASADAYQANVVPLIVPTNPKAIARFLDAGSAQQDAVLWTSMPAVAPGEFKAFVAGLDSEWTQAIALDVACTAASDPALDPQTSAAWTSVLGELLPVQPASFSLDLIQRGGYRACTMFDPVAAFANEWTQLETGLPAGGIAYTRLSFLSAFKLPAPKAMAAWGSVARQANMARARWLATSTLRANLGDLDPAELPAWRKFFVELLSATEDTRVLGECIRAVVITRAPTAAENADALTGLGVMLHSPWTGSTQKRAVCAAFQLTQGDPDAWRAFAAGLDDITLRADAAARLQDPALCP